MQGMPLVSGVRHWWGAGKLGRVESREVQGIEVQEGFKSIRFPVFLYFRPSPLHPSTSLPASLQIWSLLIWLLLALSGCMFAPPPPAPIELELYQQWQLQPGDTIAGLTVSGGLGDISIALNGKSIYAPFDGRTQLTTAGCVLFSSSEVPGYLFRLCGLAAPKLGGLRQGEAIGSGKYLEFAALRKQADGRWAIVEPSKRILERALQQP